MATATLQYRVDGGAVHTDSTVVTGGEVISFLAASYAGWNAPAVTWEIVAYPPGWPVPSGWSENTSSGHYYYRANSGVSGITPPTITIPDPGDYWGKWHFRLTVNGTIISSVIGVESVSPTLGLHDLAVREGAQWDAKRRWVGDQQDNARVLDASAFVGGGYVASLSATTPLAASAATGPVALTWAPTADVAMSSHKITGLTDPSSAQDAATKAYVDAVAAGLDPKQSVFVATTGSITLSGTQTIDGIAVTAGKRVLVKDQGDATTGIYLCAAGAWTRTTDLAAAASAAGVYCFVERGTVNGDKGFVCTNNVGSDVVGTDTLAFTQFTGSGLDANAHVLEDATTALGANGVPIRALPATLGFAKTSAQLATFTVTAAAGSVYEAIGVGHVVSASGAGTTGDGVSIAARLVDATPSARQVGRIRWEWISPVALTPRADCVISVLSTDGEHDWLRVTDQGALRLPAYSTAARRPIFAGTDGTITATAIQFGEVQTALAAASGDIAVNSQKITGLANGSSSSDAAAFGQIAAALAAPLTITLDDASQTSVPTIATFAHTYNAGAGSNNIGAQIALSAENSVNSTVAEAAYISGRLTTATNGAEVSEVGLWTRTGGGALVKNFYGGGTGIWTTTGAMRTDGGFDRASAGALTLGGTNATSIAASSLKITGLANGSSASDAAAFGQIGTAVNAAVSGTTNTLPKIVSANTLGDSGVTDDGTTVGTTRIVQVLKAGIGTTATIGLDLYNSTNSGTQYSPMERWSAWNGGTQVNFGVRWEPQSTSRGKLVFYTGTGSGAPSGGGGGTYWDSQDTTFGEGWISNGFYSGTTSAGGSGFRFRHSSNNGGLKYRSSDDSIYLTSYNSKNVAIETGADSGGSGGTERLVITSTGATTWSLNAATITKIQWGTAGVNYRNLEPKVLTTTDATVTNAITLAMADNSAAWWEVEAYCYITTDASKHAYFHWRGYFNRNGGAPVRDYHAAQTADQVIGGWGTPPSIAITAGAPGANDVSVQVTGLAATNIKWTVIARYHVTTTSA